MRVVLDTNVLLGALISPYGPPDKIYQAWLAARFKLVTSTIQLDELRRVSRYPKLKAILPAHRVGTMVNNLQDAIVLDKLKTLPPDIEADDPNDNFLISMVLTGEADYLVTGDRRAGLLKMGSVGYASILTPADFCIKALCIVGQEIKITKALI